MKSYLPHCSTISHLCQYPSRNPGRLLLNAAGSQLQADHCPWEVRLKTPVRGEVKERVKTSLSCLASAAFSTERERVRTGTMIRLKRPLLAAVRKVPSAQILSQI